MKGSGLFTQRFSLNVYKIQDYWRWLKIGFEKFRSHMICAVLKKKNQLKGAQDQIVAAGVGGVYIATDRSVCILFFWRCIILDFCFR